MKKISKVYIAVVVTVLFGGLAMSFDINHHANLVSDQVSAWADGIETGDGCCGNDAAPADPTPEPDVTPTPTPDTTPNDTQTEGSGITDLPPPTPVVNWTLYCTGANDPNGRNWEWWEYSDTNPVEYRLVRAGDGTCLPPAGPAPVCDISTDASVVTVGSGFTLTWNSQNATAATMSHFGAVNPNDTRLVGATTPGSFTFTLDVSGNGQNASCAVTVTVQSGPVTPAPTCAFTPGVRTVTVGQPLTLAWTSTNAVSATLSTFGAVGVDDSRAIPTGTAGTFTYTLHVTGSDGQTNNCHATVTVTPVIDPGVFSCTNNVSFSASPSSIDEGQNTTLTWNVTGATSVAIDNGVNTTNLMSSYLTVSPSSDTTYTLTATKGSQVIYCPVTVSVDEDDGGGGGGGGGSSAPRCTLKASDKTIKSGERITLTWTTSNATKVFLKDNHGKTIMTTEGLLAKDKKDLYDDSVTVRPTRDTTYTLTAARGSRDRDCEVKIDVDGKVTVTEVRDRLPTTIALDEVPYTGVDTKTVAQITLFTLMALWGGYLAYNHYRRPLVVKK